MSGELRAEVPSGFSVVAANCVGDTERPKPCVNFSSKCGVSSLRPPNLAQEKGNVFRIF